MFTFYGVQATGGAAQLEASDPTTAQEAASRRCAIPPSPTSAHPTPPPPGALRAAANPLSTCKTALSSLPGKEPPGYSQQPPLPPYTSRWAHHL